MFDALSISSADDLQKEREREKAQQEASASRARRIRSSLTAAGREGATEYGRLLFRECTEAVGNEIEAMYGRVLRGEAPAGRHYCALPVLLAFADRGMRPAAALALGTVIDQLSRRRSYREVAQAIGREIEDEARAMDIQASDADLLRALKKRSTSRKDVVGTKTLERLRLGKEAWSTTDRFHVGGLLLDAVIGSTGLVQLIKSGRSREDIEPTPEALAIIKANPPRPYPARRLPMLVEPRPWEGLYGGGHYDRQAPLVSARKPIDLSIYEQADLSKQLLVVNTLQRQQMTVDPWMAALQRQAWDGNLRGVFPVQRDPERHRWMSSPADHKVRVRIEECLRQCEAVAGRPMWFAYDLDFRGRVYSSNRYATHQGPDYEKAAVVFARGLPCGQDGFEWLLKAAAGHYGLGKRSWGDRLQWGRDNTQMMLAAAADPLERLELWRSAADPWQFLQAAKAVAQWLEDPSQPIQCPIRLDQTCSAVGISAALLRDQRLARHTNLIGSTRHDIYAAVAERVELMLRKEVELAGTASNWGAVFWLDFGIDRDLMKAPVMTSVYGASHLSIIDGLVEKIQERDGVAQLERLRGGVLMPARYLAKVIKEALGLEMQACLDLQDWLRQVARKVVGNGHPVAWTSPMGWPMHLASELEDVVKAGTLLTGKPRVRTRRREPADGELSARATSRGITANLVHSFDAAHCHVIVSRAAEKNIQILTNHDCFAVLPSNAEWLHSQLHHELRELYKTDWLAEIAAEIRRRTRVKGIPAPPRVGDLSAGMVGQNPYCFS